MASERVAKSGAALLLFGISFQVAVFLFDTVEKNGQFLKILPRDPFETFQGWRSRNDVVGESCSSIGVHFLFSFSRLFVVVRLESSCCCRVVVV